MICFESYLVVLIFVFGIICLNSFIMVLLRIKEFCRNSIGMWLSELLLRREFTGGVGWFLFSFYYILVGRIIVSCVC